jgi:hypothetical protein
MRNAHIMSRWCSSSSSKGIKAYCRILALAGKQTLCIEFNKTIIFAAMVRENTHLAGQSSLRHHSDTVSKAVVPQHWTAGRCFPNQDKSRVSYD